MLTRSTISLSLRLALLLACWLGGLVCPAASWAPPQKSRDQLTVGHPSTPHGLQFASAPMLEQAALLPAVPQLPVALTPNALPPASLTWNGLTWPSALGLLPAVRPCALPDLFRVRLLLTAVAPNAP